MQWSTSGKNFIHEHAVSHPALRTLTQYRHLVIVDAFLFPWGESPYIFSNLNLLADTPVNPDNGHFFLAPINLTNANTSLSTFCCNRSCLSECKIILQFTAFQCSQCYICTIHQIGCFVVVNFRLFWHPSSYAENGFD